MNDDIRTDTTIDRIATPTAPTDAPGRTPHRPTRDGAERVFRAVALQTSRSMLNPAVGGATQHDIGRLAARSELHNVGKSPGSRVAVVTFGTEAQTVARRKFATEWATHLAVDQTTCGTQDSPASICRCLDSLAAVLDGLPDDITAQLRVITNGDLFIEDDDRLHDLALELGEMNVSITFINVAEEVSDTLLAVASVLEPEVRVKVRSLSSSDWILSAFRFAVERATGERRDELAPYLGRAFDALDTRRAAADQDAVSSCPSTREPAPALAVA
ncbi:MAG: hypothetical protein Q7W51_02630 [Coriobacteriia bacterium]|nr:hypothetical protein [Coriobacteriia bacterium]